MCIYNLCATSIPVNPNTATLLSTGLLELDNQGVRASDDWRYNIIPGPGHAGIALKTAQSRFSYYGSMHLYCTNYYDYIVLLLRYVP